jgi:hypothetical protein
MNEQRSITLREANVCAPFGYKADKLALLNSTWQSTEGTLRELRIAGIEPLPLDKKPHSP